MKLTSEKIAELKHIHENWVNNPYVSKGQLEDSCIILALLAEMDELQTSYKIAVDQCKKQTELFWESEKEKDQLKDKIEGLEEKIHWRHTKCKEENWKLKEELSLSGQNVLAYFDRNEREKQRLRARISDLKQCLKDCDSYVSEQECRGDEDCDHCLIIHHTIGPAIKKDDELEKQDVQTP